MDTVGVDFLAQIQEGQLYKYTNVVKGWQHRWFILDPKGGTLCYYLSENDTKQQPRGCIHLESAVISPSEEDSNTFSVNSWTGECYKLRAADARARQDWVNRLRATAEYHSQKNVQVGLTDSRSSQVTDFCPSGMKRSLANARQYLSQAENSFVDIVRIIEKLPSQGTRLKSTDPDLLIMKATTQSMMCALENCYKILQQSSIEKPIVRTYSFLNSKPSLSSTHSKRKSHSQSN
ncbi:oxysterol-binding protein-related protein 11 [Daktulosphaira vitifoliae]|uniref:oxysterol-binding protein-related protein 11 n=1 Tax=Daktulosphaira vitifoliae TaxID=58002 RepID=UPI0021AB0758|nr:oxysterol-binding protein-related protein 11 [Daktulosphaira vitifoliae]XP_050529584.1 oxysterol-binding protein-related protein 11 [Daktulosphaira vitifoliae]